MLASHSIKCLFGKIVYKELPKVPPYPVQTLNSQTAQGLVKNLASLEKKIQIETNASIHFIENEMSRLQANQKISDANENTDELLQMLLLALQSGNINIAMLIFASLETKQSNEISKLLGKKILEAQNERRQLTTQLAQSQGQKDPNSGNTTQIQGNMQEVNDTLQMLTTFMKDVQDQKNRTVEFANQFLNNEHQTTMSVVRGMRG